MKIPAVTIPVWCLLTCGVSILALAHLSGCGSGGGGTGLVSPGTVSIDGTCWPLCASATSDPDGDGWGWENEASCVVVGSSPHSRGTPCDPGTGGTSAGGSGGGAGGGSGTGGGGTCTVDFEFSSQPVPVPCCIANLIGNCTANGTCLTDYSSTTMTTQCWGNGVRYVSMGPSSMKTGTASMNSTVCYTYTNNTVGVETTSNYYTPGGQLVGTAWWKNDGTYRATCAGGTPMDFPAVPLIVPACTLGSCAN